MANADPTTDSGIDTNGAAVSDALRLFNLDDQPMPASVPQTTPPPSNQRTPPRPSRSQTPDSDTAAGVPEVDSLEELTSAATAVSLASQALDDAIAAARHAGHSWRTIANHTGIPYQTLHQRAHRNHDQEPPLPPNGG